MLHGQRHIEGVPAAKRAAALVCVCVVVHDVVSMRDLVSVYARSFNTRCNADGSLAFAVGNEAYTCPIAGGTVNMPVRCVALCVRLRAWLHCLISCHACVEWECVPRLGDVSAVGAAVRLLGMYVRVWARVRCCNLTHCACTARVSRRHLLHGRRVLSPQSSMCVVAYARSCHLCWSHAPIALADPPPTPFPGAPPPAPTPNPSVRVTALCAMCACVCARCLIHSPRSHSRFPRPPLQRRRLRRRRCPQ
jgi:hypothetical protein